MEFSFKMNDLVRQLAEKLSILQAHTNSHAIEKFLSKPFILSVGSANVHSVAAGQAPIPIGVGASQRAHQSLQGVCVCPEVCKTVFVLMCKSKRGHMTECTEVWCADFWRKFCLFLLILIVMQERT